jgi:HAD superfamily hydrolase (TIGR01549 family)
MMLTLLLDLDNTLLQNEMADFLPVYLNSLSRNFPRWSREEFVKHLMAATQVMVRKDLPENTLEQEFDRSFYPALGIEKASMVTDLHRFYGNDFGDLGYLTRRRPEAVDLVQQAFSKNWDVVIATNPIFPKIAIQKRLNWAGFSESTPFKLITSFEEFHFAKPNPAYYAEILALLGSPDQPAVMIGDSLEDDIIPASRLGISGYLVTDHPVTLPNTLDAPVKQGPLKDVFPWLVNVTNELAKPVQVSTIQSVLALLKATPAALDTMCKNLTDEQWTFKPEGKEWAAVEILCHMRDVDREVNLPRLQKIIHNEVPFLPGEVTDPWSDERKYINQSGLAALHSFMEVRTEMCYLLNQLSDKGWEGAARHAIFGPTTLFELTGFMATHDLVHIRQVYQNIHLVKKV